MILLQKILANYEDGAFASFNASSKRLEEKEMRDLNKGKDLSFIRGTVELKKQLPNKEFEVLFKENNVSFGRFEREIVNEVDWDKIWVSF